LDGPAGAARKAASMRFKGKNTELKLTVRETNSKREFTYIAQWVNDHTVVRSVRKKKATS